jgi:hypothetical protein
MSTPIPRTDCTSLSIFSTIGFGSEFESLKRIYDTLISEWRKAETLGRLDEVLSSLDDLCRECSLEGWDSYDALPIAENTCDEAKRFIKSLPVNFPMPEIVPEPNGGIGLEWSKGNRLIFVASVSGKDEIVYAGLFGMNKSHGTEYFGETLPAAIVENIKRLYF